MTHPLDARLRQFDQLQTPPSVRLDAVWQEYQAASGVQRNKTPTSHERAEVANWLTSELMDGDLLLAERVPLLRTSIYPRTSDKAGALPQQTCLRCYPLDSPNVGKITFAIRVKPFSMQADHHAGARLKTAISKHLQARDHLSKWRGAICLQIVTVHGSTDREIDIDNGVKGLLDAMQDVLYHDDSQVQHLNVSRLRHAGLDRYYQVSAVEVHDSSADVVHPSTNINWLDVAEVLG